MTGLTRREFMGAGLSALSIAAGVPALLSRTGVAMAQGMDPGERVLVVIQLTGGNDGLNTVVPYTMPAYYKARPTLAVPEKDVIRLGAAGAGDPSVGLNPYLGGIKSMMEDGCAAVVQGVGYPNPTRSHFLGMAVWHTGDVSIAECFKQPESVDTSQGGWIGRAIDALNSPGGAAAPATVVGKAQGELPGAGGCICMDGETHLATWGRRSQPVAFRSKEGFEWLIGRDNPELMERYRGALAVEEGDAGSSDDALLFVRDVQRHAQEVSQRVREASGSQPRTPFPRGTLCDQLAMTASMIRAGLPTRVYYVTLSGFDTHSGQAGSHPWLLHEFSRAVHAFYTELKANGLDKRVMTMAFSEFGRRVEENVSAGTDHGTAAPLFLFGPMVAPGVIGAHPGMEDLDEGDLKPGVDFRGVYASVLRDWLSVTPGSVLGADHAGPRLVRGV